MYIPIESIGSFINSGVRGQPLYAALCVGGFLFTTVGGTLCYLNAFLKNVVNIRKKNDLLIKWKKLF